MMISAALTLSSLCAAPLPGTPQIPHTPQTPQIPIAGEPAQRAQEVIAKERQALAARVRKAHRAGDSADIDRFTARITVTQRGKDRDNVDIELTVKYAAKFERTAGVFSELIRYSVNEGDKPIERGKDPRPWQRLGDEVSLLGSRHDPNVKTHLDQHTRLCRQMLQFLDAGAILRGLRGDTAVQNVKLRVGRGKSDVIDAEYISGQLASFPVFRSRKEGVRQQAVFLEAWVEKATARLAAVRIYPLQEQGQPEKSHGEFIVLRDYATSKGILIPRRLLIYADNGARQEQRAEVWISAFALNPEFTMQDFARPGG